MEDVYTVTDAVVVGSLLITLLRHCDRVTVACLAQFVNVIAPIMTEPGGPAWRQTTFYPFADTARHGQGQVLQLPVTCPSHDTDQYGTVPLLHATAVAGQDGATTVFAVNRDTAAPMELTLDVRTLGDVRRVAHRALADADRHARNTLAQPDRVQPRAIDGAVVDGSEVRALLPPLSWNVIRLALSGNRHLTPPSNARTLSVHQQVILDAGNARPPRRPQVTNSSASRSARSTYCSTSRIANPASRCSRSIASSISAMTDGWCLR